MTAGRRLSSRSLQASAVDVSYALMIPHDNGLPTRATSSLILAANDDITRELSSQFQQRNLGADVVGVTMSLTSYTQDPVPLPTGANAPPNSNGLDPDTSKAAVKQSVQMTIATILAFLTVGP